MQYVTLIDPYDHQIGTIEKITAHRYGMLHRAFSIFIFREQNNSIELLLQKRNTKKYHSGGLWTNTCCGHPQPNENLIDAATQHLKIEMGFTTKLTKIGNFHYIKTFNNGLTENEIDYVFAGFYNKNFNPNYNEIETYAWINLIDLRKDLKKNSDKYTAWFKQAFKLCLKTKNIFLQNL